MVFSSTTFLLAFLPLVGILYFLCPRKLRNALLLVFSLLFYGWGEPKYILIMLFSTVFDYCNGLAIGHFRAVGKPKRAKAMLIVSVVGNLGILGFFKYTDFAINNINGLLGTAIPALGLLLPIGISFYTFQTMSYTIDVYRGLVPPQRNIIDFGAYVTLFPQLIAGPIVQYKTVAYDLEHRRENLAEASEGLQRLVIGLGKKVLIANQMGAIWEEIAAMSDPTAATAWLGAIAYTFQIYFDFSGYSDMAIGLGHFFGFHFLENFNYPYESRSVTEFWRRWHISLSTWFRDYVYIPLGGSRVGAFRRALNVMVTFTISGLWHGAAMNYVAWGAANGALQVAESFLPRRFNEPRGRLGRCAKALLTFIVIDATWLLFRAHALSTALHMAERMIRCAAAAPMATGFTFPQALVLVVGLAALGALDALHERGRTLTAWLDCRPAALRMALMLLGVLLVVIFGVWGTNYDAQAFIYFQF